MTNDGDSGTDLTPLVTIQTAKPRYTSEACSLCRTITSPFAENTCWIGCEICGAGFHDGCYWRLAATRFECALWEKRGHIEMFVCRACRS
jgi:hypothetical protein